MSADSWFRPIAFELFAGPLGRLGALSVGDDPWAVRFEAERWFVEIVALQEDGPKYCPRVHIGPLPERGVLPRQTQFDILHTLPEDSPLRRYNLLWRFADEAGMRTIYGRVLREIFEPFAVPVLCDASRLEELLQRRTEQIEREWHDQIRDHNESVSRGKAAKALQEEDYRTYLLAMEQIPAERQSASERARIAYVRKRALRPDL